MTTKEERDLEEELGPSPWPMYADEDEPWKDHERMLKLDDKFEYQYEIAHVLGCSESKVSYWMGKAEENWRPTLRDEDFECEYFEVCGYESSNPDSLCPTCLSLCRHNQSNDMKRGATYIDLSEFESRHDYIRALYDEYDDYETNTP